MFLLFATGCGTENDMPMPSVQTTQPQINEAQSTLMIYMCGSDLETRNGAATKNIAEMLQAEKNPDVNIIIQTGGAKKWRNYGILATNIQRYVVNDNTLVLLETLPNVSMGSSDTLSDFLSWGIENYPAQEYNLILMDHGDGSAGGVCFDENWNYDSLSLEELEDALCDASLPKQLEFIGFDACLMATLETAVTVEPYAKKMIASQEKEPVGGWDYKAIVSKLGTESFYDAVLFDYAKKSAENQYYTLSCIDLSNLESILSEFLSLLELFEKDYQPREIVTAYQSAIKFGSLGEDYYDLGNLLARYGLGDLQSSITCVNGALRQNATGLSIYFPLLDQSELQSYVKNSPLTRYVSYIEKFFSKRDQDSIQFLTYAEEIENKLSFSLRTEDLQYVQSVEYVLYGFEENAYGQLIYALGNDDDVIIEGNNVIIQFKGRWIELGGHLLYCAIVDKQDNATVYEAPITVNDKEAHMLFSHNKRDGTIQIAGVSYADEGFSRLHDLEPGDSIINAVRYIVDDKASFSYPDENAFTYEENMEITVVTLPDGYYQYTAFVTDIYTKHYTAGTAVIKIENGEVDIETITGDEVIYPE